MVLQIWLWESSTVPDFYLRELKYSHCLSSFFCVCKVGWWGDWGLGGGAACCTRRLCCLTAKGVIEINFITPLAAIHHHHPASKSVPSCSDWDSALRAALPSSGFPPAAWWESSTVPDFYLRELKYSHCLSSFFCVCKVGWWGDWGLGGGAACCTRRLCCLTAKGVIEINFITPLAAIHHHHPASKSVPSCSDWDSALRAALPSSGFPPAARWESSTELREKLFAVEDCRCGSK